MIATLYISVYSYGVGNTRISPIFKRWCRFNKVGERTDQNKPPDGAIARKMYPGEWRRRLTAERWAKAHPTVLFIWSRPSTNNLYYVYQPLWRHAPILLVLLLNPDSFPVNPHHPPSRPLFLLAQTPITFCSPSPLLRAPYPYHFFSGTEEHLERKVRTLDATGTPLQSPYPATWLPGYLAT